MNFRIYIVEDDPWYGQLLLHHLSLNPDYEVSVFDTAKTLLADLHKKPDLVCMDFGLPDMDGQRLLQAIQRYDKDLPVIVISGQEEVAVAVKLLKLGAKDYLIKDEHTKEMLWESVARIREHQSLKQEVETLKGQLATKFTFENSIIGQSEALKKTFALVNKAIGSNINVSLSGETGTGKEVYAKTIHYNGPRSKKPFVAVNMGAIPKDLAESELFGHERGAFTGAVSAKAGKFEEAQGGTLFLDEIGEMDLALQSKLLRVLQEREVVRIGSNKAIPVDIRLITATHKNLADEVNKGSFREDFFFRVMGLPILLPPLRERQGDVLILAKHFAEAYAKANKTKVAALSEGAKAKLRKHSFPGNVRELKAVMDLACVMCDGQEIKEGDLTFYELGEHKAYAEGDKTLKAYEAEIIGNYLKRYDGNVLWVAEKLDISKSKIYNMIKNKEIILQ